MIASPAHLEACLLARQLGAPREAIPQLQPGQLGLCGGIKLKSRSWCVGEGGRGMDGEERGDETRRPDRTDRRRPAKPQVTDQVVNSCLMPNASCSGASASGPSPLGTSNSACFDDRSRFVNGIVMLSVNTCTWPWALALAPSGAFDRQREKATPSIAAVACASLTPAAHPAIPAFLLPIHPPRGLRICGGGCGSVRNGPRSGGYQSGVHSAGVSVCTWQCTSWCTSSSVY